MKKMNIWLFINPSSLLIMSNHIQISDCWRFSNGSSDFRAYNICFQSKHPILTISFFIQQIKTDLSFHYDWYLPLFFSIFMRYCILYNCNTWKLGHWQEAKVWRMLLSTIALSVGIHFDHNALLCLKIMFWSFTWSSSKVFMMNGEIWSSVLFIFILISNLGFWYLVRISTTLLNQNCNYVLLEVLIFVIF